MNRYLLQIFILLIPTNILGQTECIDVNQICTTCVCILIHDPVCGCDGKIYGNGCFAYINGVTYWGRPPAELIIGQDEICKGEVITLTALGVNSSSYIWNTGDTTPSISVNPDSDTTFSVTVIGEECQNSEEKDIIVHPKYEITFDTTIYEDEYYFAGGDLQNISGTYYDTTQSVNRCDSIIVTNLNVISKDTCFIIIYDTIYYYDTISIYDTIAVTDTLIIDVIFTDVSPININTIKVYPNPTKDIIFIHCGDHYGDMADYAIKIVNSQGQTVFESKISQQLFEIDTRAFGQTGLYIIHIINDTSQIIETRKIILE